MMGFAQNLQFLRKIRNGMSQEALADQLCVSRQTISKWELGQTYPEMEKVLEICRLFSCSMDQLIREDMTVSSDAYSNIRIEHLEAFYYLQYDVVSRSPEEDALLHVRTWASELGMDEPMIIGWDFPHVSQEQVNIYHMHGYSAALILKENTKANFENISVIHQQAQRYIAITIRHPSAAPFQLIPNAYKTLMMYIRTNGLSHREDGKAIPCFEKEYMSDGIDYMDVYIAIE